jgi:hypothetical protein
MNKRITLLRVGWGYAMLGPPLWVAMLQVVERPPVAPPGTNGLVPLLLGGGLVSSVLSVSIPLLARVPRVRALFSAKARAFELFLVSWVLSLMTAVIPGMVGLMLGYLQPEPYAAYGFIVVAFLLTALRFPTEGALKRAVERT